MPASSFVDRVKETSPTSGTGNLVLDMSSGNLADLTGFRNFKDIYDDGLLNTMFYYVIEDSAVFEIGIGRLIVPSIYSPEDPYYLSRETILATDDGVLTARDFSAQAKPVFLTNPSLWISGNMSYTTEVKVMITDEITDLTGAGATYDGVTLVADDVVCVANPDTLTDIGIYLVASGAWVRHPLHLLGLQAVPMQIKVTNGSAYADTLWEATGTPDIVYGSEDIEYNQIYPSSNGIIQATDQPTVIFDAWKSHDHEVVLAANRTLSVANENKVNVLRIKLIQDATGSRTVTWFSGITWAGGSVPTLTTTADKSDWFGFIHTGTGTWDGFVIGQNL
jgi:hypothetical protein